MNDTGESSPIMLTSFTPSEMLYMLQATLSEGEASKQIVAMKGQYRRVATAKEYSQGYYDRLIDVFTGDIMTVIVPVRLRNLIDDGQLVTLCGMVSCRVQQGELRLSLRVTRLLNAETYSDEAEVARRDACIQKKLSRGRKDVDALLQERLLLRKVRVALVVPETATTDNDFYSALGDYAKYYDIERLEVNFSDTKRLCSMLHDADGRGYDIICITRGGGNGLERLDHPDVAETVATLSTAWVYGAGHESDKLFIRELADKDVPTPKGLGIYLRDMAQRVNESKEASVMMVRLNELTRRLEQTKDELRRQRRRTGGLIVLVVLLALLAALYLLTLNS